MIRRASVQAGAGAGIAAAQLRHYRLRTVLVVLAIALAVLSTTLLASIGVGVLETGVQQFESADRDLWLTGGPMRIAPGSVGGFENGIVDSHAVAATIEAREDVRNAGPLAFQTVYVGTDPGGLETLVGVGIPGGGPAVHVTEGTGLNESSVHYAGGSYDGPMSRQVLVDERTAGRFDVGVGDTLHVGGTVANARANEFTVVGISPTFSRFLGTPTVAMPLSELQTVTATAGNDRAAQIVITLHSGADPEAVAGDLREQYPQYEVRTNREQLEAVLGRQALVLASAGVLVLLAVVAGIALTVNVLAMLVYQQRRAFAVLKAGGVSSGTLAGVVIWQAVLVSVAGAGVGIALTVPGVRALNGLASRVVGFEGLVQLEPWVLALGAGLAIGIGLTGAVVAGWRAATIEPLSALRG